MVYDMEAKATQHHIPRQPLVPVGIGRHHREARLIRLPPHFTLAVGSPFAIAALWPYPQRPQTATRSPPCLHPRQHPLLYLHPSANTVQTFSKGSCAKRRKSGKAFAYYKGNAG